MIVATPALPAFELPADLEPSALTVLETMDSARAVRYFERESVPEAMLETLVWAATRASSPDNCQPWEFVIVTDPAMRAEMSSAIESFLATVASMDAPADEVRARTRIGAVHLISHLADVPALIVVCGRDLYPAGAPEEKYLWGSLHAAAQNMVVAGRAMGLSVVLTMLHVASPGAIKRLIGLPDDVRIGAIMAVGRPARAFGPVNRRPIGEVMHRDRW